MEKQYHSTESLMDFLLETETNFRKIKYLNIYLDGVRVRRINYDDRQQLTVREYLAQKAASWSRDGYKISTASASVSITHHVSFNVYLVTPYENGAIY